MSGQNETVADKAHPTGRTVAEFKIAHSGPATYEQVAREAVEFLTHHERDLQNAWKRGRISFGQVKGGVRMRDHHRTLTVRCDHPEFLFGLIQDILVVDHGWKLGGPPGER